MQLHDYIHIAIHICALLCDNLNNYFVKCIRIHTIAMDVLAISKLAML